MSNEKVTVRGQFSFKINQYITSPSFHFYLLHQLIHKWTNA